MDDVQNGWDLALVLARPSSCRSGLPSSIGFYEPGVELKQIGLFGGTFNPIHNGHLWAADAVREGFGLDTVVLIPAAVPPHKYSKEVAPAEDRLEMIRLAVAGCVYLSISDVELRRDGPSYTIDTIHHFKAESEPETCCFFIVGADAFLEMDTWKSYQELFKQVSMIVLDRPVTGREQGAPLSRLVHDFLGKQISSGYSSSPDGRSFFHAARQSVYLFSGEMKDVSSTLVRQHIGGGSPVSNLVPRSVADYIQRKGLYK